MSNVSEPPYLYPSKALNPAYRKVKPLRKHFDRFQKNLDQLLERINSEEHEEHHKNNVKDFLQDTWYSPEHYINTKGRTDLVIHNKSTAQSSVGVLIEAKKPNSNEMASVEDINKKALHELLYYYLKERIEDDNLEIKHLVATDVEHWFLFDASVFEKEFVQDKELVKQFKEFQTGTLPRTDTSFFYEEIAHPAIEKKKEQLQFTYFRLSAYKKALSKEDEKSEKKLVELHKVLSPEHLLKLPFANDSNTLDRSFYSELLHIIGLQEVKDKGKVLIQRKPNNERDPGSLIESTISQLDSLDKISRLDNPSQYGSTHEERLFNVALELVIIWINRVLFLKLLEGQLLTYHKKDESYKFLDYDTIDSYDDLNTLFFEVLANRWDDRDEEVKQKYPNVPYLNSSLFELSDLEHDTLMISDLHNDREIPSYGGTVLLDEKGKKRLKGDLNTIQYLFRFLDAYDFASEGSEDVQEENKTLINASVLGLIFEKINGYKEGSFFTPGFVTMFMARETVRKAVVQKFNESIGNGSGFADLNQVHDAIGRNGTFSKEEANAIIDDLKVCDPAVGSGHFLVSVLNEIIAVKSELRILTDGEGKTLRDYDVTVANDELVITDEEGRIFEYNPRSGESQRVQETLFKEKQRIIENCLFGVDINTNSVKICRLRLWIELLKNAYYRVPDGSTVGDFDPNRAELETLPNIDINIKTGNSLISRFPLDANLKKVLKNTDWTIEKYREAVQKYRHATDRGEKRDMEDLIENIKSDFRTEIRNNDPLMEKWRKKSGELQQLQTQQQFFEETEDQRKKREKKEKDLKEEVDKLSKKIEGIKNSKIYENAFEWRFEFPEVLNENGAFVGFDIVIGNPPYIRQERLKWMKDYLKENYGVYRGTADLYSYFIELGIKILKKKGVFEFIVANKWMKANYGDALRNWLKNKVSIETIYDFGDLQVFDEASTYPCLLQLRKEQPSKEFAAAVIEHLDFDDLEEHIEERRFNGYQEMLKDEGWALIGKEEQLLLEKIVQTGIELGNYVNDDIHRGVLTGANDVFIIGPEERETLIAADPRCEEIIKPFLSGKEIKRFRKPSPENYLLFTRRGIDINQYPAVLEYLEQFRERLEPRPENVSSNNWNGRKSGNYEWYEIQDAIEYHEVFESPKIIFPDISKEGNFSLDEEGGIYLTNTCYAIPYPDKYLLGVLNSRAVYFFYKNISSSYRGGYLRYIYQYLEKIPIPDSSSDQRGSIENKVDQILELKERNPEADTKELEEGIDQIVYQLYGLEDHEIEMIEEEFEETVTV